MQQRTVIITNRLGLHARATAKLVKLANTFASDILLARAEARHKTVEAKSIFGVLLLAATKGTEIEIICEGTDEAAALEAICQLIESKFGEE
ncbi:MAG: HPr family phosphocarrier protein [Acidobacteria bacterium]|nr:HPr family phosphocarrier protein [Acidobacteriota bacterium]